MDANERIRPPLGSSLLAAAPPQRWHSVSRRSDLRPLSHGRGQMLRLAISLVLAVLLVSGGVTLWVLGRDTQAAGVEQSAQAGATMAITPIPPTPSPVPATPTPPPQPEYHVVQRGESLSAIASKYNTTVANLAELNNIQNANTIQIGQQLRLPPAEQ